MEIQSIKSTAYWIIFLVVMIFLSILGLSKNIMLFSRFLIILLLAFLSSYFRFKRYKSATSMAITIIAALVVGEVLGNKVWEFFAFVIVFAAAYFASCELFEKKLIPS